jgi:hypothetical protein
MTTQIHHTLIDQEQRNTIGITPKAITALKRLRQEWQEDAGFAYPQDVLLPLLVLYDVCKGLDLTIFEVREILGQVGYHAVSSYINGPALREVKLVEARKRLRDNP